jgi:hypothetical protein
LHACASHGWPVFTVVIANACRRAVEACKPTSSSLGCLAFVDGLRDRHAPSSPLQDMRPSDLRGQGPRHPGAAGGQDVHVLHVQLRQAGPRPVLQWAGDLLHRVRGRPRAAAACIAVMLSHGRGTRPRRRAESGCRRARSTDCHQRRGRRHPRRLGPARAAISRDARLATPKNLVSRTTSRSAATITARSRDSLSGITGDGSLTRDPAFSS